MLVGNLINLVNVSYILKCECIFKKDSCGVSILIHMNKHYMNHKATLTHWGQVMHICASKLNSIGSDNGLSSGQCQAII